jgi:hypothetical protein
LSVSKLDISPRIGYAGLSMKSCGQLLCLGLVLLPAGCATVESPEQEDAESAAKAWLGLVDSGRYDKAYEQYAARIRVGYQKKGSLNACEDGALRLVRSFRVDWLTRN